MKICVIAEKVRSKAILARIRSLGEIGADVFCLDTVSIHNLQKSGVRTRSADEFFTYNDRIASLERCVNFVRNWHVLSPQAVSYNGINMAHILELPILTDLLKFSELLALIRGIRAGREKTRIIAVASRDTIRKLDEIINSIDADGFIDFRAQATGAGKKLKERLKDAARIALHIAYRSRPLRIEAAGKPKVVFFECIDKAGNMPSHISGSISPIALYPLYNPKMYARCRQTGFSYSLTSLPGMADKLKAAYRAAFYGPAAKSMICESLGQILGYDDKLKEAAFRCCIGQMRRELSSVIGRAKDMERAVEDASLVVTSNDTLPFSRLITVLAKRNGVPTMVIQHGATSGCGVAANNGSRFFGVGFLPMISDKMAVAGRISRDWLSANGVPEEKLVVTGMPQFDKYYGYGRDVSGARRNICRRFGFDERKALVLFAAQHFNDEKRLSGYQYTACETYTLLKELAAAAGSADINLIIKMHPASYEAESFYSDIMESFGLRNYAVTKHEGTDELVLAADAVITPWSTVGLEALLMDKFLVTVNLTGTPDRMPYAEEGAAKGVYSQKELKDIFLRIERDKGGAVDWQALKKFKNDYNARGERTASENCAQLILSSVKK